MRLIGIGIDWISFERVGRLLKDHSRTVCERILTHGEKRKWRRADHSVLEFSKFFVAKEAFFKAFGGVWMGLEGFGDFEVQCLTGYKFQVTSRVFRAEKRNKSKGSFFRNEKGIGAHVILWE